MEIPSTGPTSSPGIAGIRIVTLPVGPLQANCYLIADDGAGQAIVVDPGAEGERILAAASGLAVARVLLTHGHFDHVGAVAALKEAAGAPVAMHPADGEMLAYASEAAELFTGEPVPSPPPPDEPLEHAQRIVVGRIEIEVRHTPGHSPGSVSLILYGPRESSSAPDAVFSGDTLFAGSVGRTDLPGGDQAALLRSIRRELLSLGDGCVVYPGHGPATTIGRERATNPWLLDRAP